MIIRRRKNFSGYIPTSGIYYSSVIVGAVDPIEQVDEKIEEIPIVNDASRKARSRITSITGPLRILLGKRRKERQRQELLDTIKDSKNFSEEAAVDPAQQQAKKKKSLLRPFLGTGGMSARYLKNGSID